MTISELIERLEDAMGDYGPDAEVRLMTQQHWPFENEIQGLAGSREIADQESADEPHDCPESIAEECVYLVEGSQIGYGSKAAWTVAN
jgi:hypothetical protein